ENAVERLVADLERIVMTVEIGIRVEVERQALIDPHRCEVRDRPFVSQTEDPRKEPRRFLLVARRHNRVVEYDAHDASPLAVHWNMGARPSVREWRNPVL